MALLYYDAGGNPLALSKDDTPLVVSGQHASSPLAFDEVTNAPIIDGLSGAVANVIWQDHKMVAGILQRKGLPLVIAPDHPSTTDRKQVMQNASIILAALRAGTATSAQVQRVLAFLLRKTLGQG